MPNDLMRDLRKLPKETRIVKEGEKGTWEGTLFLNDEEVDSCRATEFGQVVKGLVILARRNDMLE